MADLFPLIAAQRRATADFVEHLTDEQRATPSLCDEWTVGEVAAHLTMPLTLSVPGAILGVLRHRGDFNRFVQRWAATVAQRETPASIAATLRERADVRMTPPGMDAHAPLTDIVVHGLDMRVPLGDTGNGPSPEASNLVLHFLTTKMATRGFLPKDRISGLALRTVDTGWSAGSGPSVEGPAASLLLALCGRRVGLERLTGDGVDELRRRLG